MALKCIVEVQGLQLYASDHDKGANGSVTFSQVGSSQFQVSTDGRVTPVSGASFDRETQDMYYLTVQASDGGNPPTTGIISILKKF